MQTILQVHSSMDESRAEQKRQKEGLAVTDTERPELGRWALGEFDLCLTAAATWPLFPSTNHILEKVVNQGSAQSTTFNLRLGK